MVTLADFLYRVFYRSRTRGVHLSPADYELAYQLAWGKLDGLPKLALKELCVLAWARSLLEIEQVEQAFDEQAFEWLQASPDPVNSPEPIINPPETESEQPEKEKEIKRPEASKDSYNTPTFEPTSPGFSDQRSVFSLRPTWPIQKEAAVTVWQQFYQQLPTSPTRLIDIEKTVKEINRTGLVLKFFQKEVQVEQPFVFLIDVQASMNPFQPMVDILLQSFAHSHISDLRVFYLNMPTVSDSVYEKPGLYKRRLLAQLLGEIGAPNVIVVSDAGAAIGSYDPGVIESAASFLSSLDKTSSNWLWFNPLPPECWHGTNASALVEHFHPRKFMFPLSTQKLAQSIFSFEQD